MNNVHFGERNMQAIMETVFDFAKRGTPAIKAILQLSMMIFCFNVMLHSYKNFCRKHQFPKRFLVVRALRAHVNNQVCLRKLEIKSSDALLGEAFYRSSLTILTIANYK